MGATAWPHESSPAPTTTRRSGARLFGVGLVVPDQKIDTSTAMGRMFFQILGSIAEFEHSLMSERTLDGLARNPRSPPARRRSRRRYMRRPGPRGRRVHTVGPQFAGLEAKRSGQLSQPIHAVGMPVLPQ
ncbi:recombinase family protein [Actinoplanes subglobosus]|uniref:Recombinase family protein n=1 Tax=Actinoplanes subglobosus TaxID=1547892 RepID=A0ABV8J8N8_9ACTN